MYICIYIYRYIIYTYTYIYIYTYIHLYIYTSTYTYTYLHTPGFCRERPPNRCRAARSMPPVSPPDVSPRKCKHYT